MRLDKYLKVSRLIKRRTVANDACDTERITVNGRVAKASYNVKTGDLITIAFGAKSVTVRVLEIKETTKKAESAGMYEVVSETEE
ncbi:MAG: RNA-binding S4 domain-containing protein [Clostridia bacterium]|nr:RNA-binding S4 domain-containing protein [Clostridia bacterium]